MTTLITRLPSLANFELDYNYSVALNDDQVVDLITRYPALEIFYLVTETLGVYDTPPLTLNVLGKLANANCQIRRLGLFVDRRHQLRSDVRHTYEVFRILDVVQIALKDEKLMFAQLEHENKVFETPLRSK